jgi:hypothetical protein
VLTEEARSSEVNILARPKSPATTGVYKQFVLIKTTSVANQSTIES